MWFILRQRYHDVLEDIIDLLPVDSRLLPSGSAASSSPPSAPFEPTPRLSCLSPPLTQLPSASSPTLPSSSFNSSTPPADGLSDQVKSSSSSTSSTATNDPRTIMYPHLPRSHRPPRHQYPSPSFSPYPSQPQTSQPPQHQSPSSLPSQQPQSYSPSRYGATPPRSPALSAAPFPIQTSSLEPQFQPHPPQQHPHHHHQFPHAHHPQHPHPGQHFYQQHQNQPTSSVSSFGSPSNAHRAYQHQNQHPHQNQHLHALNTSNLSSASSLMYYHASPSSFYPISGSPESPAPSASVSVASTSLSIPQSSASTPSLRSHAASLYSSRQEVGSNVRVVVRVRAFLPRELDRGAQCLVEMDPTTQETRLLIPYANDPANSPTKSRKIAEVRSFTFDNSFWSHTPADPHYATQEDVYNCLGEEFLDHNFEGYHTCIFAYGQTGSGKSYTMMGTPEHPGLIPRTCEDLFQRIEAAREDMPNVSYHVRVSYFEVYNEHVRDLLVPVVPNQPPYYLKIRESPTEGPYVKDLTEVPVRSIHEILHYMKVGDASRTVASTKMNDTSSRSHAVFTIMLKQIHHDMETDETTERSSRIRLVDLAGSERAKSTEATGQRLREGSNINKSLTTLGRVIAALADAKQPPSPAKKGDRSKDRRMGVRKDVVPYRDSILTWLLKDSLGGNSKTAMIACIAPSDYDETLSTLRYADQAKRIRTRAVVNQDQISTAERDAQIAAMAEEIRRLQVTVTDSHRQGEKLEEYQNRVVTMQRMMEEKTMVAEGKLRSLQTENEALRRHLKLVIDNLHNPIPDVSTGNVPTVTIKRSESFVPGGKKGRKSNKKQYVFDKFGPSSAHDQENERGGEDSDGTLQGDEDGHASAKAAGRRKPGPGEEEDIQEYMKGLLQDLGMFRRKIGDDKARFLLPESASDEAGLGPRTPLSVRTNT